MRAFRLLTLRRLRFAPARAAVAAVAVAAGVSLAVSILVTTASIQRSVEAFGERLAGPAELRIIGATPRGGLGEDAVEAAAQVDGVAGIVPMVQLVGRLDYVSRPSSGAPTYEGTLPALVLGVDCRVEALLGDFGCDQSLLDAAGDAPLAIGPGIRSVHEVVLRTDAGRLSLDGVPVAEAFAGLNEGRVVLLSLSAAQRQFRQAGLVDVAYVQPEPGADLAALRRSLGEAVGPQHAVVARDEAPPETQVALRAFVPVFSLMGLFGLGTAAILVRNTLALSLEERRRQLAIVAAVGGDDRTLIGGAVGEAGLLGLVGGLLGVLGGIAVGGAIVAGLSGFTESSAGVVLDTHVAPSVVVVGGVLGAAVAMASALGPARRAARVDVVAELSGRAVAVEAKPVRLLRRWLVCSGIAAIGIASCWLSRRGGGIEPWQVTAGMAGFLVATVFLLLSAAAAVPLLVGRVGRALAGTGRATWLLGLAELARDPRRVGVMAAAIVSPVSVGFATDGFVSSVAAGVQRAFGQQDATVLVVAGEPGNEQGNDAWIAPDVESQLADLPGVEEVLTGTFLVAGHDAGDLLGVETFEDPDLARFRVHRGAIDEAGFAAGEALIGPALARRTGARPGDTVDVPTPTGLVPVRVGAVIDNGDANGHAVLVHPDRFRELYGDRPATFVALRPVEGMGEEELAASIAPAVAAIDPALTLVTTDERVDAVVASVDESMVPFRIMQQALLLVAFVAVLSTLLLAGLQRRREHGLLAAVGADPGALRRIVLAEALVVAAAALATAAIGAPTSLWAMLQVVPLLNGFHNPFAPDWASFVANGVVTVVVVLVAAAWPAWRAGRTEVLESLRYE